MVDAALFSSASDSWETPAELFSQLDAEFRFRLDVCATPCNTKTTAYYTKDVDGLKQDWRTYDKNGACWMNPPYSQIAAWIKKASEEAAKGATVVALIPSRTDTRYFHSYIWDTENHKPRPGVEIRFIKGRLKFVGAKNSAPFPSMIVVFRPT